MRQQEARVCARQRQQAQALRAEVSMACRSCRGRVTLSSVPSSLHHVHKVEFLESDRRATLMSAEGALLAPVQRIAASNR